MSMQSKRNNGTTTLFTIGFTKKTAREFFELLRDNNVKKVIDIRLNNVSQLAGFSKKDDLEYFLKAILNIPYTHMPELSPTQEILTAVKEKQISWQEWEKKYLKLIKDRKVEKLFSGRKEIDGACLLCSEDKPEHCHRRVLAEYLQSKSEDIVIKHI